MIDHTNGTICDHRELTVFVDGGCEPRNPGGVATCAWVLYDSGKIVPGVNRLASANYIVADGGPKATNNVAEYYGLGYAVNWLKEQGWRGTLRVRADSQLLINQVLGSWKCKAKHLQPLRQRIWDRMDEMCLERIAPEDEVDKPDGTFCILEWVKRDHNAEADSLCRHAYNRYKTHKQEGEEGKVYFKCGGCGYKGEAEELVDDDGTLKCPICETSGFEYV